MPEEPKRHLRLSLNTGLLILRVAFGLFMLAHGIPKLMGFSEKAAQFPDPLGVGSQLSLMLAIAAEVGGSILLIVGFGTRFAAASLAVTMAVALFVVHGSDPWQKKELAAVYLVVYVALANTGAGTFSIDHCVSGRGALKKPRVDEAT